MKDSTDQKRRSVLGLLGSSGALALSGASLAQTADPSVPRCIAVPKQTEGPYFVDAKLHRVDIRSDPSDESISAGVPLRIILQVAQMQGNSCTPLTGAMVDLWHTDAAGEYSDVRDRLYDTRGRKFLRGYQLLNEAGSVEFLSVYPGWYPSRTVHIHFKVRTDPEARRGYEFSSQLYFDDAITDAVHQGELYSAKGQRTTRNSNDGIYTRNRGEELLFDLVKNEEGYTATFALALDLS